MPSTNRTLPCRQGPPGLAGHRTQTRTAFNQLFWGIVAAAVFAGSAVHADGGAITPGSDAQALQYYGQITQEFGFKTQVGTTSVDDLLVFAGYPTTGERVQALDPSVLMDPAQATTALAFPARAFGGAALRPGDILATRFFAPKIVDIAVQNPTPGWRKLVRLRTRPDSPAARSGVETVVILFNFFAPAGAQPFAGVSGNTQVMLLAPSHHNRLYWLDFDQNGKLHTALNQTFDAAALPPAANGHRDYFVPDGCNACHGSPGNFRAPMVNYLDTDHWFDRLEVDFPALADAGTPLVFDAQTNDSSTAAFSNAFDVIRRFNEEALAQNSLVHSNSDEAEAGRTWLRLHAQSDAHRLPVERGFSINGQPVWQASEAEGLGSLNRFCFRCHGSVFFSVFDRARVLELKGDMEQRINPSSHQKKRTGFKMPPDRELTTDEVNALDVFLRSLK